jgi:hypothetical protein
LANQNFRVKNGLEVGNITIDSGSGIITATKFIGDGSSLTNLPSGGGGGTSDWVRTDAGIHTTSNVGVGTTTPIYALDILGIPDPSKWVRQYFEGTYESSQLEDSSPDEYVGATAVDSSGNIYVTGGVTKGFSSQTAYLLKLSTTGTLIWQLDFTNVNPSQVSMGGYALHIDSSDNIYLGCGLDSIDAVVIKLNTDGAIIWQRLIDIQFITSIITDFSGEVYVTGSRNNPNGWVAKLSASDGTITWQRDINTGSVTTRGHGIGGVDSSNNIYVTGNYIISSYFDAYIVKLNSSGTVQWQRRFSGLYGRSDGGLHIGVDSLDNVYFLGYTANTSSKSNIVLIKFDTSGNVIWQRDIGNYQYSLTPYSLSFDSSNNIYFVASDESDLLIFKVDSSGSIIWQKSFGGEQEPNYIEASWYYDGHKNIVVDDSNLIVTGHTYYDHSFGSDYALNALIGKFTIDGNFNGKYGDFVVKDSNLGIGSTSLSITTSSFSISSGIQTSGTVGYTTTTATRTFREEKPTILNVNGGNAFLETIKSSELIVNGKFSINGVPFTETQASCKNIAIGGEAGSCLSSGTGYANIFIGAGAGKSTTDGGYNVFFGGCYTGASNIDGWSNNFFGAYAGQYNITGSYNNFFSWGAGRYNTTGNYNNFLGNQAGSRNTTGNYNNFFGNQAGRCNTTGCYNNVIGAFSGYFNTTGSYNNFFGNGSGGSSIAESNNFFGSYSGRDTTTGCFNNFFGDGSGVCNTTGSFNTFFGRWSGVCNTTGQFNTFLGSYSGLFTSSSNKIIIGNGRSPSQIFDSPKNADTQLAIGIRTSSAPANYWLVGNENFNIGIGTTNPTSKLTVGGTVTATAFVGDGSGLTNLPSGGGASSDFVRTSAGIHTLGRVGVGTTNPTTALEINGTLGFRKFASGLNISIGDTTTGSSITPGIPFGACGLNNIFMGVGAGKSTTTGRDNIFLGRYSGCRNTNGFSNNFLGWASGCSNTTGCYNTFFGTYAGSFNTTGGYNIFFGSFSGLCNTTGYGNNFLGYAAGKCNTTGSYNSFFGRSAGELNTTGCYNAFFGNYSGLRNTTGRYNSFFGYSSADNNTTGRYNSFFGNNAGRCNTTGNANIFLGRSTGLSTSASHKVIIGIGTFFSTGIFDSPNTTKDMQFAVGVKTTTATPSRYWLVGDENFNIGIGTTNPTTKLQVGGTVTATTFVGDGSGLTGILTSGSLVGYATEGYVDAAVDSRWTLGANGSSDYTFTGIGFTQTTNDPVIYLARGRVYEFVNNSGGSHPFEIRVSNGGSAYNTGVTNNGAASGTIRFEIPFDAPNTLYYQCTAHSGMGNTIVVYPNTI